MSETLEQMALRIAQETLDKLGWGAAFNPLLYGVTFSDGEQFKSFIDEFARRLRAEWDAEQQGQEPVAFATNGYGKISLYWREGIAIDFIPNGMTIGLYAAPPQDAQDAFKVCKAACNEVSAARGYMASVGRLDGQDKAYLHGVNDCIAAIDAAMCGKGE